MCNNGDVRFFVFRVDAGSAGAHSVKLGVPREGGCVFRAGSFVFLVTRRFTEV